MKMQSGTVGGDIHTAGWQLHQGDGVRKISLPVEIKGFGKPDQVLVAIKEIDTNGNVRISCSASSSPDHIDVEVVTWAESKVFGAQISWLAIKN